MIDLDDIDRMVRQGDSFALADVADDLGRCRFVDDEEDDASDGDDPSDD